MKSPLAVLVVLAVAVVAVNTVEAVERFKLVVDAAGPSPFLDATHRHDITTGGVADVDPGPDVVPGTVVPTNVLSPDGARAALFTGGWLDITTSNPSFASDFLFAADQNISVAFWFRSTGNGPYDPTPSEGRYADRMHAMGCGDASNNLDVDLGDDGSAPPTFSETACWTYFGGGGANNVIDSDLAHDRNFYLDDQWHLYTLVRDAGLVTVYIDQQVLGTTAYDDPLGSESATAHNYIGRASVLTANLFTEDPFPWFGYIAGVRVFDEALIGVDERAVMSPGRLSVSPNPFHGNASLRFAMPVAGEAVASIYDIGGRIVRQLYKGSLVAGNQQVSWNGEDDRGRTVAPGLYIASVQGTGLSMRAKVFLVR